MDQAKNVVDLVELATLVGSFSAALAIVGIPLTLYQTRANFRAQQLANAKEIYRDFLELSLQHPKLAYPIFEDVLKKNSLNEYRLFMWHLLFACEEILTCTNDQQWRLTVIAQLERHKEFLRLEQFQFKLKLYSDELGHLIEQTLIKPE